MLGIVPYQGQPGTLEQWHSPAPTPQKPPSTMWEWYRQIKNSEGAKPESTLEAGVSVLRHNAESAALSAVLGFIQGELGSLDIRGVPVDAVGALLLNLLAISKAGEPNGFSSDFRALGQTCTTVYFYRTVERWRSAKKVIDTKGESMNIHTSSNTKESPRKTANIPSDPIVEAGRRAGL